LAKTMVAALHRDRGKPSSGAAWQAGVVSVSSESAAEFESQRPRLFALAYRLLGSATDAEDVVQEAFLRWDNADRAFIDSPPAWLTRVVTNLCLNVLTSARVRREQYVGPWLPEPVLTADGAIGPLETAERRESVSLALLVLLERLTPAERGVFVLREAFGYGYREIADVLELSEANCRQIHRRAGQRLGERQPRFTASPEQRRRITERFLSAASGRDLDELERLLSADVVAWADGGGQVSAARRPVHGRDRVARYVVGLLRWATADVEMVVTEVNYEPAVVGRIGESVVAVMVLEITDGHVSGLRTVANPDKLTFLARQLSHRAGLPGS
jgi:RNA polymerase sigma-70 factor (ECF subfamily)